MKIQIVRYVPTFVSLYAGPLLPHDYFYLVFTFFDEDFLFRKNIRVFSYWRNILSNIISTNHSNNGPSSFSSSSANLSVTVIFKLYKCSSANIMFNIYYSRYLNKLMYISSSYRQNGHGSKLMSPNRHFIETTNSPAIHHSYTDRPHYPIGWPRLVEPPLDRSCNMSWRGRCIALLT